MYTRFVSVLKGRAKGEVVGVSSPIVWSGVGGAVGCAFEVAEFGIRMSTIGVWPTESVVVMPVLRSAAPSQGSEWFM